MPVRRLKPGVVRGDLERRAADLQISWRHRDPGAAQRIREFHPEFRQASDAAIFAADLSAEDAQRTIAGEHGFQSWERLLTHLEQPSTANRLDLPHHERIDDPDFREAVRLIDTGAAEELREHLRQHPGLIQQRLLFEGTNYFQQPGLLQFIAENPVRHGRLADNIVDVTRALLEAGPDPEDVNETLMLVATGSVAQASSARDELFDLLCGCGGDKDQAARAAAVLGELGAMDALLHRGAHAGPAILAARGEAEQLAEVLSEADRSERHLAFALAAQYGHIEVVRVLLDAGEDPNRYHPVGGHSHCTALHQAGLEGNTELALMLFARGARADVKDLMWNGTPADWAAHNGHSALASLLRDLERGASGNPLPSP